MNRLLVPRELLDVVEKHLDASAPLEEGLFLLAKSGRTTSGIRMVAFDAILPDDDSWDRQGSSELTPSGQWLSVAMSRACALSAGLVLVHSHPHPWHPVGLSELDLDTFRHLAPALEEVTEHPFAMVAVSSGGWSGNVSQRGLTRDLHRIDAIGPGLHPLSLPMGMQDDLLDGRQILALGESNRDLRSLSVAVVGCGGTGSAVAEQVYRMGVARLVLVDDDALDTESNLRRVGGARYEDAHTLPAPAKVDVVAKHLDRVGLPGTEVVPISGDIRDEVVARQVLDCDVVVGTTDTHGSRGMLNDLAYAYALPVVDVGARVAAPRGELEGLWVDRRILLPGRPCLWCTGEIDQATIRAENLSTEERGALAAEGYVAGNLDQPQPSVIALNALAASLASCSVPALLGDGAGCVPDRTVFDAVFGDSIPSSPDCSAECRCIAVELKADDAPIGFRKGVQG